MASTRNAGRGDAASKVYVKPGEHDAYYAFLSGGHHGNIYVYGIRGEGKSATHRAEAFMKQKRFDATKIHTHTFPLEDLPTAIRYAKDHVEDAIKVVVKMKPGAAQRVAAE